jgi:hypothetical protein
LKVSYYILQISNDHTKEYSIGVKSGKWYRQYALDSIRCLTVRKSCMAPARTDRVARNDSPADHIKDGINHTLNKTDSMGSNEGRGELWVRFQIF